MLFCGIVHEDVEPTELMDCSFDGIRAESGVAHVACDKQRPPPVLLDRSLRLSCVLVLVEIHYDNVRSLFCERYGDGGSDAAIAAGDNGDLILKFQLRHGALVLRFRLHLTCYSGPLFLRLARALLFGHARLPSPSHNHIV